MRKRTQEELEQDLMEVKNAYIESSKNKQHQLLFYSMREMVEIYINKI